METFQQWIEPLAGLDPQLQRNILSTGVIILVIWLLRLLAVRILLQRTDDVKIRYSGRKTVTYVSVFVAVLLIAPLWLRGFKEAATYLGLVSAGLAIALRDPIVNLIGWLFIVWRRPFGMGDRIEIDGNAGDVIDIRIFAFSILEIGNWVNADQSTGRVVHIPNAHVLTKSLANYSRGFEYIWNELPVLVTFESNWQKAKKILQETVDEHAGNLTEAVQSRIREASSHWLIFYSNLTPTVYTSVEASGVLLTMRFLCPPRRRRTANQELWEDILEAFAAEDDIDFAYPTRRLYHNTVEGKPGTQPPPPQETGG